MTESNTAGDTYLKSTRSKPCASSAIWELPPGGSRPARNHKTSSIDHNSPLNRCVLVKTFDGEDFEDFRMPSIFRVYVGNSERVEPCRCSCEVEVNSAIKLANVTLERILTTYYRFPSRLTKRHRSILFAPHLRSPLMLPSTLLSAVF